MKLNLLSKDNGLRYIFIINFTLIISNIGVYSFPLQQINGSSGSDANTKSDPPYNGVDMHGFYTRTAQARDTNYDLPDNYFEESFRILSDNGLNHVRFLLFWESFIKNPEEFLKELKTVANTADKYNIKILYDNHQFHTSSYLNPQRGNGFPFFLFEGSSTSPAYSYGSGGSAKYESANTWWTSWWNRQVSDANGTDGWTLMSNYLKEVVNTVDGYESTLGYEILSEPQVHSSDQWAQIGAFNNFVVNELRKITDKTIAYSMNIPVDLKSPIGVNPENLALMAPENKTNVVFKISLYGLPTPDSYQGDRLAVFVETSRIAQVPLYIGEWNNVKREQTINEEGEVVFQINPQLSDIDQSEADLIVETFKDIDAWGMAYWQWRVGTHQVENYNLINVTLGTGEIETTKYFDILTNAYLQNFGNLSSRSA